MNGGAFAAPAGRLRHLPLALFAAPMGLCGLGLAWREAGHVFGVPAAVGEALLALAALVYAALLVLHLRRGLVHPGVLATDLRHPVRAAFAGAVSIGLMLNAGRPGLQVPAVWGLLAVTAITALVALRTFRAALSSDLLQPEGG